MKTPCGAGGFRISGNRGVTVRRNQVRRTGQGGIVVQQHMGGLEVNGVFLTYPGPPAHDIVIEDNVVADSAWTIAPGAGPNSGIAGIVVNTTTNDHFMLSTEAVNTNITIRNNSITDSGFSGLWVSEVAGGVIEGNQIVRPNRRQVLPFWGINPPEWPIYQSHYRQPIAVLFSTNVVGGATRPAPQYLPEGATGSFFDTRLALFNPSASDVAIVNLTFQQQSAANIAYSLALPPHGRKTLDLETVTGLASASFATEVDASMRIVVDRTMSWDATGYGSHAETARRRAVDDVVSGGRVDVGRLRAVLPAAEPERDAP